MAVLVHSLPYHHDSAKLFERVAHEPWAMFLDSGKMIDAKTGGAANPYGQYDLIVARPIETLVTKGSQTMIDDGTHQYVSSDDPFSLLNTVLSRYPAPALDVPFAGGAMGYFAYDLGRRLEKIADKNRPEPMPEMMVGIYDWAIVVDHCAKKTQFVSYGFSEKTKQDWASLCDFFTVEDVARTSTFEVCSDVVSNFTQLAYQQAFNRVAKYIQLGDCYQVNLAQRFSVKVQGDSWLAYKKLRAISPAPFMAFMQLPNADHALQILSNSPERFIQVLGRHVETRPIKGTRPRGVDLKQDLAHAKALQDSRKDQAENVMIVDLLRNDIGKSCEIGSVKVDQLFQLQSFANVHHLVSMITAKLNDSATVIDLLRGCFPGGSITGAPKVRAMQIIEELEPSRRGLYCGAIGYIGFDGNMDTNIAIRTAVVNNSELSYYAGGGIVADSTGEKEYLETLDKASTMRQLLKFFRK